MEIRIVNALEADLDCPKQHDHVAGEVSPHFPVYYNLLTDNCQPPASAQQLYIAENAAADPDCGFDTLFSRSGVLLRQPLDIDRSNFIDPYFCTIGSGCAPQQQNC